MNSRVILLIDPVGVLRHGVDISPDGEELSARNTTVFDSIHIHAFCHRYSCNRVAIKAAFYGTREKLFRRVIIN